MKHITSYLAASLLALLWAAGPVTAQEATRPALSDGTMVDALHPMPVVIGGSAGASAQGAANASSLTPTSPALITDSLNFAWNGASWDAARAANTAAGTTGTGLLGAGNLGFDGTNWQKQAVDTLGQTKVLGSATFSESTGAMAASGTYNGVTRDMGATSGPYSWFSVYSYTTAGGGTLYAQWSTDNTTWFTYDNTASNAAIASGNQSKQLSYRVMGRYNRALFANSTTAQTVTISTSYTAN